MKYDVCVVTGTRAEYGVLKRLLFKLRDCEIIRLKLLVTGSHLHAAFGNTQTEIIDDGFKDFVKIPIPIEDDTKAGMAIATGVALAEFAKYFQQNRPDLLIVLGDRYEILSVAAAAHLMGVPIAHISGGDVTEGAVDDAIRHCITKMSTLHFPGCEQSRQRIIQMGETPDRVFNVGEPGVENCLHVPLMSREELAENLSVPWILGNYALVTYHPVTMEEDTAIKQVNALIAAMDEVEGMSYIITMANADAQGRAINDMWAREKSKRSNWLLISSLGMTRYLSAMKYCSMVIGNSSSGIIEAPSMGVPTVNIGDRQKGRMMAESVLCCDPKKEEILSALRKATSEDFQRTAKQVHSPFGDGRTSQKILSEVLKYLQDKTKNNEKRFYDIDFSLS